MDFPFLNKHGRHPNVQVRAKLFGNFILNSNIKSIQLNSYSFNKNMIEQLLNMPCRRHLLFQIYSYARRSQTHLYHQLVNHYSICNARPIKSYLWGEITLIWDLSISYMNMHGKIFNLVETAYNWYKIWTLNTFDCENKVGTNHRQKVRDLLNQT